MSGNSLTVMSTITVILIPLIMITAIHANAQSQDWIMTVNLYNVPFGVDKVFVEVKGPFGADQWQWVPNGIQPSTTFSLSGNDFPSGYNLQLCAGTGLLASILPSCTTLSHDVDGDQTFSETFH